MYPIVSAGWKEEERQVARLLGGSRYHANTGGDVDVESDEFVVQVKHRRTMSLAEALARGIATEPES